MAGPSEVRRVANKLLVIFILELGGQRGRSISRTKCQSIIVRMGKIHGNDDFLSSKNQSDFAFPKLLNISDEDDFGGVRQASKSCSALWSLRGLP